MDDTEGDWGGREGEEKGRRGGAEKEMKKKRVVLARRNDDAGRVELLAATQVGRPAGDCRIARLISSRAIVLEPNIIFPFAIAFRGPDP